MEILRSFVYLDTVALNDYLSSVFGHIYDEESVTEKSTGSYDGSLSAGVGPVTAKTGGKKESEVQKSHTAKLGEAAKFQKLYGFLHTQKSFGYHEAMDADTWGSFGRNTLLEAAVNLRFSKLSQMFEMVDSVSELGNIFEQVSGQSVIDSSAIEAISGFKRLSILQNNKGVNCVMPFIRNDDYKLIATLKTEFMRTTVENMAGEITVFGKITRLLQPNERFEMVDFLPDFQKMPLNREQKRNMPKKSQISPPELKDTIKGPAAIVNVLAIYK